MIHAKIFLIILCSLSLLLFSISCKKQENTLPDKCLLEPEVGPCNAAFPKYYYDQEEGKCKEFIWGGCGGVVPFETMAECENACG
jgi:hypothetical protein